MTISINTKKLMFDIWQKSHIDVAGIEDIDVRYRTEIGTDKPYETEEGIKHAAVALTEIFGPYYLWNLSEFGINLSGLPEDLVFELDFSERRLGNRADALATACGGYLAEAAMSYIYDTIGATDLSTKRANKASDAKALVMQLVYSKNKPYTQR